MAYEKYYENGWKNNEEGATPITAAALNHMEEGIVDLDEQVSDLSSKLTTHETLTATYIQNNYVTPSDFQFSVYRVGNIYTINANLWLSNSIPSSLGSFVEIGRISNYSGSTLYLQVANGSNTLSVNITDTGIIKIGRVTSSVASGWYRFFVTTPVWDYSS